MIAMKVGPAKRTPPGAYGGGSVSPAGFPNEPSGYTIIDDNPWDVTNFGGVNPHGWLNDHDGTLITVTTDAAAPYSPLNVAAGLFPNGTPGGGAPFSVYREFATAEQFKNMYIGIYLKHSANFDNTNGNAGTKFIWPAGDQVEGSQLYTSHDGVDMDFQLLQQGSVSRTLPATMNASVALMDQYLGQFVRYELLLKASSSDSTSDGEFHCWINGTKTHQYADVRYQMQASRKWMSVSWQPTYGGGLNPVPHDQWQYMDHIRLSGSNV